MPALFIGCVAALGTTVLLLRRSILTEKLARRGQHIAREYSVDLFELMRVRDVMEKQPPAVLADLTVAELSDRIAQGDPVISKRHGTLLLDRQGKLAGIITRGDMMHSLQTKRAGTQTVLAAGKTELVVSYPDEPLHDAIAKMLKAGIGRLPVVSREDERQVLGYLGRGDILAARQRQHEEEELREHGPLVRWQKNGRRTTAEVPS